MGDLVFGTFVPQGWRGEFAGFGSASNQWNRAVEVAKLAESLGFDALWVYDHFHNVPEPIHETMFESWTMLTAISQQTSRIRIGQLVASNPYRHPGLLAKMTSTLDVISGGRLNVGVGAGWSESEFKAYGYAYDTTIERIEKLGESIQILRSMWTNPDTSFDGAYYQLAGAQCDPKPIQQPGPPVWIGGSGEKHLLRLVAQHGDWANFYSGEPLEKFVHRRNVLAAHCEAAGRNFDDIGISTCGGVLIRETEKQALEELARLFPDESPDEWENQLYGTVEQVVDKVGRYIEAGCRGFTVFCDDFPGDESLRGFATVMDHFR
jgi:F420-dependent oxidoreductase-like protein